jgi:endonuclease-3
MGLTMTDARKSRGKQKTAATPAAGKRPFDIEEAMRRLREATAPYPKAALFELAAEGHTSVFEILIACIISIRTLDEVTLPVSRRLFARARTPAELLKLSEAEIDELIRDCNLHQPKSRTIREIARRAVEEFGGELPCDTEKLQTLHGVGPKCSSLAVGIACGQASIGVDVHVHRVTNRWGYVHTRTPAKTMKALQEKLPREYWVEINALLVPFGKHICTGVRPKCSTCPLLDMCQQVGVTSHR